jgi:citrate lyase subunit beta/citryl-CoA lyase
VESADGVRAAEAALVAAGAPRGLALWAMIETPRGVLAAPAIAAASPRLACLVAGTSDLVKDLRARHTPGRAEVLAALAAAPARPDAVLLPKVESAEAVVAAAAALDAAGAPRDLPLWAMIETPRGVLRAAEIAAAPRLGCLVAGTSDLVKDLRARHTAGRAEVLTALSLTLLAARANGLDCLDGVHLDLDDLAGFEAACRQGRELGFDGKTLIHPKSIEAANRAFGPTPAELDEARRILVAHAEAASFGRGVVVVEGRLVEALHVEAARRRLALADALAARGAG